MRLIDVESLEMKLSEITAEDEKAGDYYDSQILNYAKSIIADEPTACDINAIISELKDLIKTVDEMGCPTLQFRQALGIIYHHTKGDKE